MSTRAVIRSTAAEGFHGRYRAGRLWPKTGTPVDLIDAEDDAPDVAEGPEGKRVAIPQIGRKTLAIIKDDLHLSVGDVQATGDLEALRARVKELEAQVSVLEADLADAQSDGGSKQGKSSKR
jgi:hypothetical protein